MSQPRFKFTGTASFPKADSKKPFCKVFTKDGIEMVSMNFGVQESKNSMGFVECFGSIPKNKVIKTKDTDGNDIEISWDNRFDENTIKSVANYRKYIVDLGEDFGGRKEFITQYDAILYLKDNLHEYKGLICVTGQMKKDWYETQYYDKFIFQNVYGVDEEHKPSLRITVDIYYKKDCIDKENWKEDKVIGIDGYIQQYINKEEGTKFIPQRFIFNASKLNPENEKHIKLLNYKLKYVDSKAKKWEHLLWEVKMLNGAEEVDFDESQLTDAQKEQIELGIKTLDDFKPNGSIFGERVNEYRLLEPSLIKTGSDDFSNGFISCEMTDDEFDELIYHPAKKEKMSDLEESTKKESEEKNEKEVDIEDELDDDDLFG